MTLQQDYLETRARLEYARTELAHQKELYGQDMVPQENYQRAQADYHALLPTNLPATTVFVTEGAYSLLTKLKNAAKAA